MNTPTDLASLPGPLSRLSWPKNALRPALSLLSVLALLGSCDSGSKRDRDETTQSDSDNDDDDSSESEESETKTGTSKKTSGSKSKAETSTPDKSESSSSDTSDKEDNSSSVPLPEVPKPYKGKKNPNSAGDQKALDEGKKVYAAQGCLDCHGKDGKGPIIGAPDLSVMQRKDDYWLWKISEGSGDIMTPFKDHISEAEIWAVISYMRTFAGK